MRAIDIIARKRDGEELSSEEINWFIEAVTHDEVPDYQTAAWLMAVYLCGMSRRETLDLAQAMARSGEMLDLSGVTDFAVDKHSSGGVGDKTTLIVQPLVVACGVPVGKMTGRALGFSGGTLDKMESIQGYRADLTTGEFLRQLKEHGIVLSGQSADLAPADGKLYALRDVTATVSSPPLIASSIMSKKLAAGANGIVLDVKMGVGAFMERLEDAHALAQLMLEIGRGAGRKMIALISDMNQPLGRAVGNALEVREAIEVLHGGGPADLRAHCLTVAGHMLRLAGVGREPALADVTPLLEEKLQSREALARFRELVELQGGAVSVVDAPELLPQASIIEEISAERNAYLARVSARAVGRASVILGAGRQKKGDTIDHAVGIIVHHKVGGHVKAGQPLFTVHANSLERLAEAREMLAHAVAWSDTPVKPLPLFYEVLEAL
jgi:pyrimidine-nucleoside phosphorylase